MDSTVALAAAAAALFLIILLLSVLKKQIQSADLNAVDEPARQEAAPGVRRAVAGRNNRVRNRFANRNQERAGAGNFAGDDNDEGSYDENEAPASLLHLGDQKVGKKKMAKLEDLQKELELIKEEELKREILEKEKREHEEYLQMKAAFTVEEQGFEAGEEVVEENLLQRFIDYIKDTKIVLLEELAATFQLKTQDAIDRLQKLVQEGEITGKNIASSFF